MEENIIVKYVEDGSQFRETTQTILDVQLPSAKSLISEGCAIAKAIKIGRTAFMDKMGVVSEVEYKRQCIRDGTVMYHAHIGMSSWKATAEALTRIYSAAEQGGFCIDRAGICLDRRMGLPAGCRKEVPAETGPTLESNEEWIEVGQRVPI